jgi:hypothetical protein
MKSQKLTRETFLPNCIGSTFSALTPNGAFYGTIAAVHYKGDDMVVIPANVPVDAFGGGFLVTPDTSITLFN